MTATAYLDTYANDNLPPRALWPELLFDLDELSYPQRLNCAAQLLDNMVAGGHADAPAIYGADGCWTYQQLLDKVDRIAHVLRDELRLTTGNRVLLRGANNPMMAACVLAVWKAGYIAVPTMPLLRAKELATIIDLAKVNAVLCAGDLKEELAMARGAVAACSRGPLFQRCRSGCARPADVREAGPLRGRRHLGRGCLHHRLHLRHHRTAQRHACIFIATSWPFATASRVRC